jgi:hypothetical protein
MKTRRAIPEPQGEMTKETPPPLSPIGIMMPGRLTGPPYFLYRSLRSAPE